MVPPVGYGMVEQIIAARAGLIPGDGHRFQSFDRPLGVSLRFSIEL